MTTNEPRLLQYDVLVCGGGVSGCAAAIASARSGAKTLLLERNTYLGGIASSSMISNIYNHYVTKDERIVMKGIGLEIAQRLVDRHAGTPHWMYADGRLVHDPEQLKSVLDEMVSEAGVDVLFNTFSNDVVVEESKVKAVYADSPFGKLELHAKVVVDASGECDIAWRAQAPTRYASGLATLTFKMAGVDLEALYQHFRAHPETFPIGIDAMKDFKEFERDWLERGVLYFPHSGGEDWDLFQDAIRRGEFNKSMGNIFGMDSACIIGMKGYDTAVINSQFWRIVSIDPVVVSPAEVEAHEACYYVADFMRTHIPGFKSAYIAQVSDDLAIRVSRGIIGEATMDKDEKTIRGFIDSDDAVANGTDIEYRILRDLNADKRYIKSSSDQEEDLYTDDVIACRPKQKNFKLTGEFVSKHTVDIPFAVMVPQHITNLLVASGKSVSCVPQTMLRYQSAGMALGQGAGVAAALASKQEGFDGIYPIKEIQKVLLAQGVYLGTAQRLQELGLVEEEVR